MQKIKRVNEFVNSTDFTVSNLTDDELFEMANLGNKATGLGTVVIWVGPNPKTHGMRIKVSNVPNKSNANCFTITIPDLKIIGKVNVQFITTDILENIKKWIVLNHDAILKYSNEEILTEDFIELLHKV